MIEFLTWLFSGAGAIAVVSYLAERSQWFSGLDTETKKHYKTLTSTVIALAAYALSVYVPADFWVMLDPYWKIAVGVLGLNYGVEVFHAFDRTLVSKG
jgi:hypothetical protein